MTPKEIIAYEAWRIYHGDSMLIPTKEHFNYLGDLLFNGKTMTQWGREMTIGKLKAERFYSEQFNEIAQ